MGTSSQDLASLSFLSFVYPGTNWSLAFYRHKLASFRSVSETQGLFGDPIDFRFPGRVEEVQVPPGSSSAIRLEDIRSFTDFEIDNYGVSGAIKITEAFSFGAGLALADGRFTSRSDIYPPSELTLPDGLFGRNTYPPEGRQISSQASWDDQDWTFSAGFLWHISPQWNLGGFYRGGCGRSARKAIGAAA